MAILKIARLGNPVIRKPTEPVPKEAITSPEIQRLIDDMVSTMHEYEGVGLAAPQVHVSQQVAVLEVSKHPRYPDAPSVPLTVLINPKVTMLSEETVALNQRLRRLRIDLAVMFQPLENFRGAARIRSVGHIRRMKQQ